jgi:PKHD-type hydroxylase
MWFLTGWKNESWAYIENAFSEDECKEVIRLGTEVFPKIRANTFGKDPYNDKVRRSDISWLDYLNPECDWLYRKCTDLVTNINNQFFQFDLLALEQLQFTQYHDNDGEGGMYDKHCDYGFDTANSRKLSFSVQLSNENSYEGGELLLHTAMEPVKPSKKQGTINFFPSFTLHEVTPVTLGTRYSLVGWVNGPKFK